MAPAIHPAGRLALETVNAARRWSRVRAKLRQQLDSKSAAAADVNLTRAAYSKASDELELTVRRLEKYLLASGRKVAMRRAAPPFPWQQLVGMLADGAKAVESAISTQQQPGAMHVESQVIDVEPE